MGEYTFPDPRNPHLPGFEGIVAIGGDLNPERLRIAYRKGIFPWPMEDCPLTWFCPEERAVLHFKDLHLSKSIEKGLRKSGFTTTIDQNFNDVIDACASVARKVPGGGFQQGTWITREMNEAYKLMHKLGHAHSVETWKDGELVGGIYGVDSGGVFSAESMFYKESYASRKAILTLIEHLKSKGLEWLDIQVMTPHMLRMGASLLERGEFLDLLDKTLEENRKLF